MLPNTPQDGVDQKQHKAEGKYGFQEFLYFYVLEIYIILLKTETMTDFFNAPFQKYGEGRVELQENQEDSPTYKNRSFNQRTNESYKLRAQKLSMLPQQIQQKIQVIVPAYYLQELKRLEDAQYLTIKNSKNTFFGETTLFQSQIAFFKHKNKVAHGLCQIFFEDDSYLIGFFEEGRLQKEFVFITKNGNYIKTKQNLKQQKRSVSRFITDDSQSLASDEDSQENDKIDQSDINFSIQDHKAFELFSDLQCEISFNGIYYQGSLKKGQLNGHVFQKAKDYEFKGNFVLGSRKSGKMVSIFGFQYEGTFKNNKFDGLGTLKTHDGVYSGEFKNGLKDGQGEFNWIDGSSYKGDFKKDQRHGKGFFKSRQGSFKGQWKNDEIQGAGYLVIGNHGVGGQWRKNQYEKPNKFY